MGLESVELVMQVEDTFGIKIPDEDAGKLISVGQLYEYVRRRLSRDGVCVSRHVFYRLRAATRVRCRPNEPLDALLPIQSRLQQWRRLADEASLNLPPLRRPEWVATLGAILAIAGALFFAIATRGWYPAATIWSAAMVVGLVLLWLVTVPLATRLPPHCCTLGDLTRIVAVKNASRLRASLGWGNEEIWKTLQTLISDQLGIVPEQVTPDKEFIRDLGMG